MFLDFLEGLLRRRRLRILNRELQASFAEWKSQPHEPIPDAEAWVASDGQRTAIVPEDSINRDTGTISLSLEMFHTLMGDAGYTRIDDIDTTAFQSGV